MHGSISKVVPIQKKEFNCHFEPPFLFYAPRVHSLHTTASSYCLISLYLHHLLWKSKKPIFCRFFSCLLRTIFVFHVFHVPGVRPLHLLSTLPAIKLSKAATAAANTLHEHIKKHFPFFSSFRFSKSECKNCTSGPSEAAEAAVGLRLRTGLWSIVFESPPVIATLPSSSSLLLLLLPRDNVWRERTKVHNHKT